MKDKWQGLRVLLSGYMHSEGYNYTTLAAAVIPREKQGRQRISRMINKPESMTIAELTKIGWVLGIPIEEIRLAIPK